MHRQYVGKKQLAVRHDDCSGSNGAASGALRCLHGGDHIVLSGEIIRRSEGVAALPIAIGNSPPIAAGLVAAGFADARRDLRIVFIEAEPCRAAVILSERHGEADACAQTVPICQSPIAAGLKADVVGQLLAEICAYDR